MLASLLVPSRAFAQDLGFISSVFGRVHRLSLFAQALHPRDAAVLDRSGHGCITMSLCGAGARVMIDLDTRSNIWELELGFGAGYLRPIRGSDQSNLDLRGALRSLPVISAQGSLQAWRWINPYFAGSFGLVDLMNGRVHDTDGRQAEVKASSFEYGLSVGLAVQPPVTNGRALIEFGYRARNFASVGYGFSTPIPSTWPRELDMSGWQLSAGWQVDLRPIARPTQVGGAWVLSRADAGPLPLALKQERRGDASVREELVSGYLDVDSRGRTFALTLVAREVVVGSNGVTLEMRFTEPRREQGTWSADGRRAIARSEPARGGDALRSDVTLLEDELVVQHGATGRRLYFRKIRGG